MVALAVWCGGCGDTRTVVAPMPWLHGFVPSAVNDVATTAALEKLAPDSGDAYGAIELTADVAGRDEVETVVASYSRVAVLDPRGRVLASTQSFERSGSRDEVLAVAVGDAFVRTPVFAVATSTGGHRESSTWLVLYRVGSQGHLDQLFAGVVETAEDQQASIGSVTVYPGGLAYRAPRAETPTLWSFDPERRRYVEQPARLKT